jgi:hypothetical protein
MKKPVKKAAKKMVKMAKGGSVKSVKRAARG